MKNILVTGGAGYIGSHVVVRLHEEGFNPIILDNFSNSEKSVMDGLKNITGKSFKLYEGDCLDRKLMKQVFQDQEIEGIIHFAAKKAVGESVEKPLMYYENNISALVLLLQEMTEAKVQNLVFSSSCTVYGQPEKLPVTEETPKQQATSPYGNTKAVGEEILEDTVKSGAALKIISLRYFNPIGAHPSAEIGELPLGVPNNLVPFIMQTAAGIRKELTVFGDDYNTPDGTCIRDYIHVMDLADAHVQSIRHLNSIEESNHIDFINIGTGKGNTVLEAINAFEKETGQKLNYKVGPRRPGDVEKVYAQVDKSKKLLNWECKYTLSDAMRDSWKWQQALSNA
ncbi:UDP-galactose 4-epimerase [Roseivirga pacifica]|uniref:UDP-glucose 4-epimerase n=1 Tax=Roseivirga pacifica TaxID=1267423 RepID=A0A1I0N8B9_9BACT|nr:UDP-glucose 4-epimerase GalE [Roseivirga pacifica]RKQ50984.1 UDP-galactose 4-epimerase [Roseivirga pacifica]SEV97137.1 UDP-galactose 4-epimerase [Roseivirga pacifica]